MFLPALNGRLLSFSNGISGLCDANVLGRSMLDAGWRPDTSKACYTKQGRETNKLMCA